ncbi:SDR family oxidoreductase [Gordonia polyisoprenivorans]|uniref:SDR family oxidoreductase n=1 Tax=Gordonia polyisoprenivorans TaxID=84595 RepID=UPI00230192ED|nr:SDR family oxidoreductase [Gordonia polyisoprenivorans]WCB40251.1 SDR family oxidoreductase [Gordonia polyisoprenivorans]
MVSWKRRRNVNSAGVNLALFEAVADDGTATDDDAPTILLVHGWPDTHVVWDGVAAHLARHARVFAYDTRGMGESDRPLPVSAYRIENLADDLFAVAATVNPGGKVHVVAHDWGSIQSWEAVSRSGAATQIASFTSISGPSLDHVGALLRHNITHPTPRNLSTSISQMVSSTYIGLFHLPVLPRLFLGVLGSPRVWREFLHLMDGTPRDAITTAPTLRRDMNSGVRYYRANIIRRLLFPSPRTVAVPVLELLNTRDFAIRPTTFSTTHRYVTRLWRRDAATGHWLPSTHPAYIAENVRNLLATLDGDRPVPESFSRTRRFGPGQAFTGRLAVITGAGSGIGRETARALAELGCDVVLADVDTAGAEETARLCKESGSATAVYHLDVADTDAFIEFAKDVERENGVPDIVVNNAATSLSGSSLDATDEQIDRLLEIDLRGVLTGCREFGRQMVTRGTGGHIVNLASAAAFTPQRELGIYAAAKAGVLLYSESLRAELAEHHIGVSAICPTVRDTPDADEVATQIVTAIRADKAVVPVTPEARIGYRLYRFAPWISRVLARRQVVGATRP